MVKKITVLILTLSVLLLTSCGISVENIIEDIQNISVGNLILEEYSEPKPNKKGSICSSLYITMDYRDDLSEEMLDGYVRKYIDNILKIEGIHTFGNIYCYLNIRSNIDGELYPGANFIVYEDGTSWSNIGMYKLTEDEEKLLKLSYKEIQQLDNEKKIPLNVSLALHEDCNKFLPENLIHLQSDIDRIHKEEEDIKNKEIEQKEKEEIESTMKLNKSKYTNVNINTVDYKTLARNPEKFENENLKYSGEILQVLENSDGALSLRIAINGNYDTIIYGDVDEIVCKSLPGRLLEDDVIEFGCYGTGLKKYTSTSNLSVSIPSVKIEYIEVK